MWAKYDDIVIKFHKYFSLNAFWFILLYKVLELNFRILKTYKIQCRNVIYTTDHQKNICVCIYMRFFKTNSCL